MICDFYPFVKFAELVVCNHQQIFTMCIVYRWVEMGHFALSLGWVRLGLWIKWVKLAEVNWTVSISMTCFNDSLVFFYFLRYDVNSSRFWSHGSQQYSACGRAVSVGLPVRITSFTGDAGATRKHVSTNDGDQRKSPERRYDAIFYRNVQVRHRK